MCGWWQISKASSLTGGIKIPAIPFTDTLLPLFRFEIGPYQRDEQLTQIYAGTVALRDGTRAQAFFHHHRWANSKATDVDFERFDIVIKPGTLFNQAYQISYGGYYDRDKGQFVLRDLATTLVGAGQSAYRITPEAYADKMKE